MTRLVSTTSASASPARCWASQYRPERATSIGTISALVCASEARTALLMRALSCSLSMNLPIATGTSAAEINAPTAESSVGRPAGPSTSVAPVPGPVVGSASALPAAGCAQHQPEKHGCDTGRRHPPRNACSLRHHKRQHRTEQRAGAPEALAQDQTGQEADDDADHHILDGARFERRPPRCIVRRLVRAFDRLENRFRACPDAPRNVARLEARHDLVANDTGGP